LIDYSQSAAQRDGLRQPSEKAIGGSLDGETIEINCVEDAAESWGRFEQREFRLGQQLVNTMRCREPRQTTADDGDARWCIRKLVAVGSQMKLQSQARAARPTSKQMPQRQAYQMWRLGFQGQ